MPSTPAEIFSEISSRIAADPAKTAGMNAVYAFDLSGEAPGQYHISIKDGSADVGEGSILRQSFLLQVGGSEVSERIGTWVVVEFVAANERTQCEECGGTEQMVPRRRDIERPNLGTLVRWPHDVAEGVETAVVYNDAAPRRCELGVKRIRSLEP